MAGPRTAGRSRVISDTMLFWRLWHDRSVDILEIARQLHVSIGTVRRHASRMHLPARPLTKAEVRKALAGDPSLDEIWGPGGLTEQIRASWTPQQEYDARMRATTV
jgi:hypothetical protein